MFNWVIETTQNLDLWNPTAACSTTCAGCSWLSKWRAHTKRLWVHDACQEQGKVYFYKIKRCVMSMHPGSGHHFKKKPNIIAETMVRTKKETARRGACWRINIQPIQSPSRSSRLGARGMSTSCVVPCKVWPTIGTSTTFSTVCTFVATVATANCDVLTSLGENLQCIMTKNIVAHLYTTAVSSHNSGCQ